jgi:hypothetical protein
MAGLAVIATSPAVAARTAAPPASHDLGSLAHRDGEPVPFLIFFLSRKISTVDPLKDKSRPRPSSVDPNEHQYRLCMYVGRRVYTRP